MTTLDLLITLAVLSFGMAAIWYNHLYNRQQRIWARLMPKAARKAKSGDLPGWVLRLIEQTAPTGERYTSPSQRDRLERLLFLAGQPWNLDLHRFLGLRFLAVFAALALGVLLAFFFSTRPMLVLTALAYLAPVWWLKAKANDRQLEIAASLPDFLDTLAVSLRAGVGFLPALRKVADRFGGPLGAEFSWVVEQIDMGVPIATALHSLLNRTTCRELELCIGTLTQSLDLGVPVAPTLVAQAASVRLGRVQRAKEQAAKASPKITLLTTFLVTPGVFLLILGMVILNIFYHPEQYGIDFLLK